VAFHFLFFLFSWFLSCSCQLASALVLRRTRVFSRCVFVAPSFFFPCPSYFFVKGFFFLFHPRLFFFFTFFLFLLPRFPRSLQPPYKSFFRFLANVSSFPSSLLPVLFFCGDRPHGPSHVAFHFYFFSLLVVSLVLVPTRLSTRFAAHEGVFPLCLCGAFFLFSVSLVLFCERVLFSFSPSSFFFFPFLPFSFPPPTFCLFAFFFTPSFLSPSTRRFRAEFFCAFLCEGVLFSPLWSATFFPPLICTSF